MTTSPDRYVDLMPEHDDRAPELVVDALDRALHAVPAPPGIQTTMQRVFEQQIGASAPSVAAGRVMRDG